MARTTKKTAAKKTAAKKTAAKKTAAKKTAPAKKAVAKKAPAKKAAAAKITTHKSSIKLGDSLVVNVDPRSNNGSAEAAAHVTRVLNTLDDRVNVRVLLDNEDRLFLRNVPVLSKAPKDGDEDAPEVYALKP